jgi:hypothetical protein
MAREFRALFQHRSGYNQRCELFRWTKIADQILTKADRQKNSDTRH